MDQHACCNESRHSNKAGRRYDIGECQCRGVMKELK